MYKGWKDTTLQREVALGSKFDGLQSPLGSPTVDSYQQLGLVRWDPATKMLECPFIWLQIISAGMKRVSSVKEFQVQGCAVKSVCIAHPPHHHI